MEELKTFLRKLRDVPITAANSAWFVDREQELKDLTLMADIREGEIIGVTGERGIGKTSLLHMLPLNKLVVDVVDRESKMGILKNILYAIHRYAQAQRYGSVARQAKDLLTTLERVREGSSVGLSHVVSVSKAREREREPTLLDGVAGLRDVLQALAERERLVVVLDEIDKDSEREVLLILDLLKDAFLHNDITLLVTLPPSFRHIFLRSAEGRDSDVNVENVLKAIYTIPPMDDAHLTAMVEARTGISVERVTTNDAADLLLSYSEGNPRRFISMLKESGFLALRDGRGKISREDVERAIVPFLEAYVESLGLSERDKEVLFSLREGEVADVARELRMTKPLLYKYLKRLSQKGLVEVKHGFIYLPHRTRLIQQLLGRR